MAIGSEHVLDDDLLKGALRHLYDPSYLRRSPLVGLLGLSHETNPAEALRTTLERSIDALKPDAGRPCGPQGDRHYRILYYRYVQQFPPRDVAHQLGISLRHLRREQACAFEALAEALKPTIARVHADEADDPTPNASQDLAREMDWVEDTLTDEVTEVAPVINEALRVVRPLADRHGVVLQASVDANLCPVAAGRTVFKEVIITLVTAMLDGTEGGRVNVSGNLEAEQVVLRFMATRATAHEPTPLDEEALDIAHRLVDLSAGTLRLSATGTGWAASVTLPTVEQVTVLAIEDNIDTLQLWERYLQDTRFRLVRAGTPNAALATAIELQPAIIVLDVMMPGIDGWDLLMQLRNHIRTAAIPVVVCTVLPHGELALSLGATGFIRKPATRESFRGALERGIAAAKRQ